MGTLVCFHAHPDDESISTGGTMARAVAEGHRVVLVVATNGDHGESPDDLAEGESLVDRRRAETALSVAALGVHRLEWLNYADSGMTGWEQNHHERSFLQAPVNEAAGKLAAILREEAADVLTTYDWHGNYGHPDHIKVHQVVRRATELASVRPRLFEATMNRDASRAMFEAAKAADIAGANEFDPDAPMNDGNPLGTPEVEISLQVDVSDYLARRRAVMECHRSQVSDVQAMLSLPELAFAGMFSNEYFIAVDVGNPRPMRLGWFF